MKRLSTLACVLLACTTVIKEGTDGGSNPEPSAGAETTGSAETTEPTSDTGAASTTGGNTSSEGATEESTSSGIKSSDDSTSEGPACGDEQLAGAEECDDGNLTPGDGCSEVCLKEWRRAFVTSLAFGGDLNGLEGADEKCQSAAEQAALSGTYKAWLSDSRTSATARLTHSMVPYVRVDSVQIAKDWTDLTDGSLLDTLTVSELGGPPGQAQHPCQPGNAAVAWTGTDKTGNIIADSSCSDWNGAGSGQFGRADEVTFAWTAFCTGPCDASQAALFCFEQ